jgi:hypothetical protein
MPSQCQLLVLAPLKKTSKQLEKIGQGFLWEGRAEAKGGNCHVNWKHVCRPIAMGALGVHDLDRAGLALCLCWLWLSHTDRAAPGATLSFNFPQKSVQSSSLLPR